MWGLEYIFDVLFDLLYFISLVVSLWLIYSSSSSSKSSPVPILADEIGDGQKIDKEVPKTLHGTPLKSADDIITEGDMLKQHAVFLTRKTRKFVLHPFVLNYYRNSPPVELKGSFHLSDQCSIHEKVGHVFTLVSSTQTLTCVVDDIEQYNKWISCISDLIKNHDKYKQILQTSKIPRCYENEASTSFFTRFSRFPNDLQSNVSTPSSLITPHLASSSSSSPSDYPANSKSQTQLFLTESETLIRQCAVTKKNAFGIPFRGCLLLTSAPRVLYIDSRNSLKTEINWFADNSVSYHATSCHTLKFCCGSKTFKFHLEDDDDAKLWVDSIDHALTSFS